MRPCFGRREYLWREKVVRFVVAKGDATEAEYLMNALLRSFGGRKDSKQ
jgi:hypothetical protein